MEPIKRKNKTYTDEFKAEAVALVKEHGYTVADAAESLGVRANQIYQWMNKLEAEASGLRLTGGEREELIKLRRENKNLRMEKEILKKASAFFAKEMK